jgi:alpha-1,6-mannosyltransferase
MEISFKSFKTKNLTIFAVFVAAVFGSETLLRGYDFYTGIISGHKAIDDVDLSGYLDRFRIGCQYLGLTVIYLIWLLRDKQKYRFSDFADILRSGGIFLAIAYIGYPVTHDIYLYLKSGAMALNGVNPYLTQSGDFTSVLSPFIFWNQTSTYGPVSQIFFMISAYFIPVHPLVGVYIFKLICLGAHILNAYLIWRHLKPYSYQNKMAIAYLLNPLLLFEQVTEAHVDVFVCTSIIFLITSLRNGFYIIAALAIWLGFLSKTLPIIWLPLFAVFLVKQRHWKSLSATILVSCLILLVLRFSLLPSWAAWTSLFNPGIGNLISGSLQDLLRLILNSPLAAYLLSDWAINSKTTILTGFRYLAYFGFCVYYAAIALTSFFSKNYWENKLISDMGWVTLVLLLFATPWLMPWYPSILLPFIALNINSRLFVVTSFTFATCLSCSFYLLGYGPLYGQILPGAIGTVLATIPAIAVLLLGSKTLKFSSIG